MKKKIKNALISVSDKDQIISVLKILEKYKINIISSGGTSKLIKKMGYKCKEISEFTNFKEMLDGRVKTLHPKIHSGILFKRSSLKHQSQMKKKKFESIDLVIINFYPFQGTLRKTNSSKKIIENIDIGGPTMVRAAAKNFQDVTILTDKNQYPKLVEELERNKGKTNLNFRERMANEAFNFTAYYDSIIANWFNQKLGVKFPERKTFFGRKLANLRYGENPHQNSSIYISGLKENKLGMNKISGKDLSYNNYNDIFAGLEILFSEKKLPLTVIIKHANPCGVSSNKSPIQSFKNSMASDPVSAFGGIAACNYKINQKLALEMNKIFFEVIMAKGFDKEALDILKKRKNMRIIDISRLQRNDNLITKNFIIPSSCKTKIRLFTIKIN